jgi:hypothetical protein
LDDNRAATAATLSAAGNVDVNPSGGCRVCNQRAVWNFDCYVGWLEMDLLGSDGNTSVFSIQ